MQMALSYNEPITFGRHGTAMALNCTGIDFLEDGDASWTNAPVAELDIQLPFARQDLFFELTASPFIISDIVPAQKVFVYMGGLFVGFCSLVKYAVKTFPVCRSIISGRPVRLALVIPTATSPNSLHMSEDMRELGIYLNSIAFRTVA
jgi:hypothetical protein